MGSCMNLMGRLFSTSTVQGLHNIFQHQRQAERHQATAGNRMVVTELDHAKQKDKFLQQGILQPIKDNFPLEWREVSGYWHIAGVMSVKSHGHID